MATDDRQSGRTPVRFAPMGHSGCPQAVWPGRGSLHREGAAHVEKEQLQVKLAI